MAILKDYIEQLKKENLLQAVELGNTDSSLLN